MDDPCRFQESALACVAVPSGRIFTTCFKKVYFSQDKQVPISLHFCYSSTLPPMTTQLSKCTSSTARWEVLMLYFLLQNTNTVKSAWNVVPKHLFWSKRSGIESWGILAKLLHLNLLNLNFFISTIKITRTFSQDCCEQHMRTLVESG